MSGRSSSNAPDRPTKKFAPDLQRLAQSGSIDRILASSTRTGSPLRPHSADGPKNSRSGKKVPSRGRRHSEHDYPFFPENSPFPTTVGPRVAGDYSNENWNRGEVSALLDAAPEIDALAAGRKFSKRAQEKRGEEKAGSEEKAAPLGGRRRYSRIKKTRRTKIRRSNKSRTKRIKTN